MYLEGNAISIDPDQTTVELQEDDWLFRMSDGTFEHLPTHVSFEVKLNCENEPLHLTVSDFVAVPVHICSEHPLPHAKQLESLGKAAIILYVRSMGLVMPDRPEHDDQKHDSDLRMN